MTSEPSPHPPSERSTGRAWASRKRLASSPNSSTVVTLSSRSCLAHAGDLGAVREVQGVVRALLHVEPAPARSGGDSGVRAAGREDLHAVAERAEHQVTGGAAWSRCIH